jgi:hypothetical protein
MTWELSESETFDPAGQLELDVENEAARLVKVFNYELLVGRTYYVRARSITNFGISKWSNTEAFTVEDVNDDIHISLFLPTNLYPPSITLDYPLDEVPPSLFFVRVALPSFLTRNNLTGASYVIEDTEGTTVFKSIDDNDNAMEILVFTYLRPNSVYTIRASQGISSHDKTEYAGISIYVPYNKDYTFKNIEINDQNGVQVEMNRGPDFASGVVKMFDENGTLINSKEDHGDTLIMSTEGVTSRFLVFSATETTIDGTVKEPTYTIINLTVTSCTLPHPLPYSFGCGNFVGEDGFPYAIPVAIGGTD